MRYVLLHDTGSVGLVCGAVLGRLLRRQGHIVDLPEREWFDIAADVRRLWDYLSSWQPPEQAGLVLMSLPYRRHGDPSDVLARLADASTTPLEVWSHRWPDGYVEEAGLDVRIPPFDLAEDWRFALHPPELELLRLCLPMAREVAAPGTDAAFLSRSSALEHAVHVDPYDVRQRIVDDPAGLLATLDNEPKAIPPPAGQVERGADGAVRVDIDPTVGGPEKVIEALLTNHHVPESTIAVARAGEDTEHERLLLVRRFTGAPQPSVRWLLESLGPRHGLPPAEQWLGPQDAVHLRVAGRTFDDIATLRASAEEFAVEASAVRSGQRRPGAGVLKPLWDAARRELNAIDLLDRYTDPQCPQLRILPSRVSILHSQGNRSGSQRSTLVLPIQASTPRAAAFLFAGGGYNLTKLERTLEGILDGMAHRPSTWLTGDPVPRRLRIDVELDHDDADDLAVALAELPSTTLVDAEQLPSLVADSPIDQAMRDLDLAQLVMYRESETIGPSIPYAILLSELTGVVASNQVGRVRVLDLFAGSGSATAAVLQKVPGATVHAVDAEVRRSESLIPVGERDLVWLRADAVRFLRGDPLDVQYDVIGMDPPHAALFDLVFAVNDSDGQSALAAAADRAPWLVLYQGHTTQSGRARVLSRHLESIYPRVETWQLGQELVLVAGPDSSNGKFEMIADPASERVARRVERYGWRLDRHGQHR